MSDSTAKIVLTPAEERVAFVLVTGASNKTIARELNMSEGTVKVHLKQIMKKTGGGNRCQAAIKLLPQAHQMLTDLVVMTREQFRHEQALAAEFSGPLVGPPLQPTQTPPAPWLVRPPLDRYEEAMAAE